MIYYKEIKKIWLTVSRATPEVKLGAYLEVKGYQVSLASPDFEPITDFFEEIEAFEPDVVLLQAGQPGFDGHELCRQLKANRSLGKIPVIIFDTESSLE